MIIYSFWRFNFRRIFSSKCWYMACKIKFFRQLLTLLEPRYRICFPRNSLFLATFGTKFEGVCKKGLFFSGAVSFFWHQMLSERVHLNFSWEKKNMPKIGHFWSKKKSFFSDPPLKSSEWVAPKLFWGKKYHALPERVILTNFEVKKTVFWALWKLLWSFSELFWAFLVFGPFKLYF